MQHYCSFQVKKKRYRLVFIQLVLFFICFFKYLKGNEIIVACINFFFAKKLAINKHTSITLLTDPNPSL